MGAEHHVDIFEHAGAHRVFSTGEQLLANARI
jgi:hypothetical protein